jgi:branched-chain amino acid transport system permease protein
VPRIRWNGPNPAHAVAQAAGRVTDVATATRPRRYATTAVGLVVAFLLAANMLPHGAPLGIIVGGVVLGSINGLVALSIVLVYKANRTANFAAASFGSVAAVVAIELHIQVGLDYVLSMLAGIALAAVLGAFIEMTIIRRFANAPRLILMVATIGLAVVLDGASIIIPVEWSGTKSGSFSAPWNFHFRIAPVLFNANYVVAIIVVPVVLVALTWFLRYTSYGVAIRAAADNGDRARLLGLPVNRLSTIVWTITGVLSALAVLLRVPILGFLSFSSVSQNGPELLLQTLAAAVVAGMASMPVTIAASICLGIASELAAWSFHDATAVDVVVFGVVLIALLTQRNTLSRAADSGISTWQNIRPIRPTPPELAHLRQVRLTTHALRLGLLAFALTLPLWISPAHTQLATDILIYAIVAGSLVVLTGWAGHVSLGQIAFMGFGGATMADLAGRHGWDIILALVAGALVAGVVAVVIGIPALRISGQMALGVVTLAFGVTSASYFLVPQYMGWFASNIAIDRPHLFGRIATDSDQQMYYVVLFVLAASLAAVRGLRNSNAGRAMIAGQDNRFATQSFAINTTRVNLVAFAISGTIAGLAGGLYTIQQVGFNPAGFSAEDGLTFFMMVVIGGLGSIPGAVLGAIYVYGAQYLLPPGWDVMASGAGLLLLLMFMPGGLGEVVFRVRDAWLRRLAAKHRIYVPSLVADTRVEDEVSVVDADAPAVDTVPQLVASTGMAVPTPPPNKPAVAGAHRGARS